MAKHRKPQLDTSAEAQRKDTTASILEVSAEPGVLRGVYTNVALIRHSYAEFVLDFMLQTPDGTSLVSRVLTNPGHMKRLAEALNENVKKYEATFGSIPTQPPGVSDKPPSR